MSAFIGSGKIKIAPYESGVPFGSLNFVDIGNTSALQIQFAETRQELRDYQDPAGGVAASTARIESVTGSMDKRDFKAENIARALWGSKSTLGTTAIVGEAHVFRAGGFFPTDRHINTAVAPVLKKGATTLDVGDYVVSKGGITFISTTPATVGLLEDDPITIDYTPVAGEGVETLTSVAPNVAIFFEGVNTVDGKAATVRIYKVKLGAASNLSLIGDDFGNLPTAFTIEKEDSITGAGLSKFFTIQQET